ncbi:MAG TPA: hypothetical protein VMT26_02940 [Candidatus Bathyarchaeia archaeon]|jgi:hypothetical protein|nr:hypothetical protein [Candidatus Bathyarchaeia archaeon]
MSEEGGLGTKVIEKFAGIIVLIVGILATYFTYLTVSALGSFVGFFGFLSVAVIVLGLFLITAKTE